LKQSKPRPASIDAVLKPRPDRLQRTPCQAPGPAAIGVFTQEGISMNRIDINRTLLAAARTIPAAAALALLLAAPVWAAEPFMELLELSLKERKGVVVYLKGQAVAGRVTRLSADAVELTSREYTRIVVRRDAIDGVAAN